MVGVKAPKSRGMVVYRVALAAVCHLRETSARDHSAVRLQFGHDASRAGAGRSAWWVGEERSAQICSISSGGRFGAGLRFIGGASSSLSSRFSIDFPRRLCESEHLASLLRRLLLRDDAVMVVEMVRCVEEDVVKLEYMLCGRKYILSGSALCVYGGGA